MNNKPPIHHSLDHNSGQHTVSVGPMRVMVVPDGEYWFVQGLEVDYFAEGTSVDHALQMFVHGLELTIEEHIKMYGHVKKLTVSAPQHVWDEFYSNAQLGKLKEIAPERSAAIPAASLPFSGAAFYQQVAA